MMNKAALSYQKYGQFIKFCIVGVANTTISLVAYYILMRVGVYYLVASTIAYCVGILNGFFFSSTFVFKRKMGVKLAVRFVGVYLSSLLINLGLLFVLVDFSGVPEFLAQVMVTFFNVIYNYFLNKLWTFK